MILLFVSTLRRYVGIVRSSGASAMLLGFFLLTVVSLAHGSAYKLQSTFLTASSSGFTIADFDGDQKPDFATVQAGRSTFRESHYSIDFQLSTGSTQSFGLIAPAGGLRLDSRDVNGDHLTDLIVSTTWLGQTVAIFINDGHGSFTLADPKAYPTAKQDLTTRWSEPPWRSADISGISASRRYSKATLVRKSAFATTCDAEFAFGAPAVSRRSRRDYESLGRAPPFVVLPA